MRILFLGAVTFSARTLRELIAIRADVVGVCTLKRSALNAGHADLAPIVDQAVSPLCHPLDNNRAEVLNWISESDLDIIFCCGWSRLIRALLLGLSLWA
jgi:methionyl-tRNA formyltransferase